MMLGCKVWEKTMPLNERIVPTTAPITFACVNVKNSGEQCEARDYPAPADPSRVPLH